MKIIADTRAEKATTKSKNSGILRFATIARSTDYKEKEVQKMNAEELTKKYNEQRVKVDQLTKTVEYLEQEVSKLRMIVDDMKIDIQMEKMEKARVQK